VPSGKYKRSDRLRELYREEIAAALKDVKDPGLSGFITITDVDLSGDTKTARVHYSVLGSAQDRRMTAAALERAVGFIRRRLYGKLRLKFTPNIAWVYDTTPEEAQKIDNLLSKARAEDENKPAPEPEDSERLNDIAARASAEKRRRRPRRGRPQ
jgi:ribosome-binding factor A